MTDSFFEGLGDCPLHRRTPFGITNVSKTQFSVARHYGMMTWNGDTYIYHPPTDELIRADVFKWKAQQAKQAGKQAKEKEQAERKAGVAAQRDLPDLL